MASQPPNRQWLRNRTKSDLDGQSPVQSSRATGTVGGGIVYESENGGIQRFPDYDQPATKPDTTPKPNQIQSRIPIPESVPSKPIPGTDRHPIPQSRTQYI